MSTVTTYYKGRVKDIGYQGVLIRMPGYQYYRQIGNKWYIWDSETWRITYKPLPGWPLSVELEEITEADMMLEIL